MKHKTWRPETWRVKFSSQRKLMNCLLITQETLVIKGKHKLQGGNLCMKHTSSVNGKRQWRVEVNKGAPAVYLPFCFNWKKICLSQLLRIWMAGLFVNVELGRDVEGSGSDLLWITVTNLVAIPDTKWQCFVSRCLCLKKPFCFPVFPWLHLAYYCLEVSDKL